MSPIIISIIETTLPRSEDYRDWSSGRRRLVGTYGYLAPEILSGGEYSPASDLWSAGVILYVLMTGVPPVPMGVMKNARSSLEALQKLELRGVSCLGKHMYVSRLISIALVF